MDFDKFLKVEAKEVEKELDSLLTQWAKEVKKFNPQLTPFAIGLINSTKGGKKIRGILVKLGFQLAGGSGKNIRQISAAFEILHAALLIHDDIADKSPMRRGQPSLYKALGGNHYGISQAINIGDIGLYLPIKLIAESNFSNENKLKALTLFSQIVINTGWGQVMDVAKSGDVEFINLNKTAKYTIAGPLQIGAILAGGNDKLIRELEVFGENLGIAFQIQDDILDGEVQSKKGTKTKALNYVLKAKKVISNITKDPKMSQLLMQMAEYLVERTK